MQHHLTNTLYEKWNVLAHRKICAVNTPSISNACHDFTEKTKPVFSADMYLFESKHLFLQYGFK